MADLTSIRRWLTQPGSGRPAAERLQRIRAAIRALKTHPFRWPTGEHPGTRERTVESHKIIYTITLGDVRAGGWIDVLRVFGPGQNRDVL